MAQVLMKEPNIVIMDEPTGTMDPLTRASVTNSILNAREKLGETFVIVSHDMDFVHEVCDRVALIEGGKIIGEGDPNVVVPHLISKSPAESLETPKKKTSKKQTGSGVSKTDSETPAKTTKAAASKKPASKKADLKNLEEKAAEKENIEINTDGGCV